MSYVYAPQTANYQNATKAQNVRSDAASSSSPNEGEIKSDVLLMSNEELIALALSVDEVISVRSFCIEGMQVFGILTAPIYLKSERDKLLKELKDLLCANTADEIIVTFNTEVYRKIKPGITDAQKLELLEKAR